MPSLAVDFAGLNLKNPLLVASGTYGWGEEFAPFFSPEILGGIITKGVSLEPWPGNPAPRLCETPAGLLNAIGLENPGVKFFIEKHLPRLREYRTAVVVNIVGKTAEEYAAVASCLEDVDGIDALEMNISCPNIKAGGLAFGTSPEMAARVTTAVRQRTSRPLIVKLSPNVTDITVIARAVEEAGADALSLINTVLGMAIDVRTRRPVLGNVMGGLSGPAIRPVAVRMVYQTAQAVKIPILGLGGITSAEDALQFIMAGATAVAVGTANFADPRTVPQVLQDLDDFLAKGKIGSVAELVGAALPERSR